VVFPSVVGAGRGGRYVGAEAMAKQSLLKMSYPVQHGIIVGWDDAVRCCSTRSRTSCAPIRLSATCWSPSRR